MNKHIVLCTLGTRGDIGPFAALATVLHQAGARVSVLSNYNWRGLVEATGANFIPIAMPDPPQSGRNDLSFFRDYTLPSYQATFDFVAKAAAGQVPLVLVGRSNMLGMEVAAERFAIPHINVALQPSAIVSCQRPAWPLSRLTMGPAGEVCSRTLVPAIYRLGHRLSPYRTATTAFRRANGSDSPSYSTPPRLPGDLVALLCPEWFAMPSTDWQSNVHSFGFPFEGSDRAPDMSEANHFLMSGPPAIVATPGTGVTDVKHFSEQLKLVARMLGMRLMLISPHLPLMSNGEDVATFDFLPLRQVLPHAAILIHHGGIGTVGAAISCGCRQLVISGRFDQPDNGVRVAQLGLGGAILRNRPSVHTICEAVGRILGSDYVGAQVRSASAQVSSVDAIGDLAATILAL